LLLLIACFFFHFGRFIASFSLFAFFFSFEFDIFTVSTHQLTFTVGAHNKRKEDKTNCSPQLIKLIDLLSLALSSFSIPFIPQNEGFISHQDHAAANFACTQ